MDRTLAEKRLDTSKDDAARALHFARPLRPGRFHDEGAGLELDVRGPLERGADGRLPRKGDFAVRKWRRAQKLRLTRQLDSSLRRV